MEWALPVLLVCVAVLPLGILLLRQSQNQTQSHFSALRTELAQEMASNRREMQAGLAQTTHVLETKVTAIDARLDLRLQDLTQSVSGKLDQNLKEGFVHFARVQEHLKNASSQLQSLNVVGQSITDLNNLLKLPHLRGGFGEATLERMLADWLPTGGYELQYRIIPNSTERVDAVVKYPNYVLPIDSKFPREQVLPLFETNNPQALEEARRSLVDVMKTLGRQISEKYIHPEHGTADMALLFVPSETLYFEVLRNPRLCEELARYKVFAVSPNTLAVTLHAVSTSRAYYEMSRGVEKTILDVRKAQQHFDNFEQRFEEIGTALGKAQNAFNIAGTHLSRYNGAVVRLTTGNENLSPEIPPVPELPGLERPLT